MAVHAADTGNVVVDLHHRLRGRRLHAHTPPPPPPTGDVMRTRARATMHAIYEEHGLDLHDPVLAAGNAASMAGAILVLDGARAQGLIDDEALATIGTIYRDAANAGGNSERPHSM